MLAYQLLEKFDEYNIYPIHVKLSSFNYKEKQKDGNEVNKIRSLKNILISKRINEEMIKFLKKKKTLLIFDGIDEVPCKHDIIKFLEIDQVFPDFTDSRRIFTCRKEELTKSQANEIFNAEKYVDLFISPFSSK